MPVGGGPSNGSYPSTAAMPVVFSGTGFDLVFEGGGGTQTTDVLHSDNLPGINVWLLQTSGAGLVTATVQFADGQIIAGIDWQKLAVPFPILSGVESRTNYKLGSRLHRVSITSTGVAVVRYRLTNSLG
jgi:hypothetical protein